MHLTGMAGRNDPARRRSLQNRSKSLLLGCLAAVALSAPANAQTKTFTWVSGMCTGTLRYDPKKLDVKALDATTKLLSSDAAIPVPPHIATPADVAKIDIAPFERECAGELDKLRQTTLPIAGIESTERFACVTSRMPARLASRSYAAIPTPRPCEPIRPHRRSATASSMLSKARAI